VVNAPLLQAAEPAEHNRLTPAQSPSRPISRETI